MKRGRRSGADLAVKPVHSGSRRVEPPSDLSATEAALFRKLIADCAPDHFVPSDRPLLVSYVQATLLARRAAKSMTTDASFAAAFERAAKIQAMLATRLRLAPQSRADPKTVARRQSEHKPSAYDLMDLNDD
jgi:hypothetical protein